MISLDWSLLGRHWAQTADGRILCRVCGQPSRQVVFRTLTAEDDQGRVTSVLRRTGPLCPTCDTPEGANP